MDENDTADTADTAPASPERPTGGRGQTLLRTFYGTEFISAVEGVDRPVTDQGLLVTAAQAESIMEEASASGLVFVDHTYNTLEA